MRPYLIGVLIGAAVMVPVGVTVLLWQVTKAIDEAGRDDI
jgi:hypothetical protein